MEEESRMGWKGSLPDNGRLRRSALQKTAFSCAVCFWFLTNGSLASAFEPQHIDNTTSHLKSLERQFLPARLIVGEPRCEEIVDYYWDANPELEFELKSAKLKFNNSNADHRRLILVAGPAGVGKTFIKRGVYDGLSRAVLRKFDARELLEAYRDRGFAEFEPDLHHGSTVFNKMLTLTPAGREHFCREMLECGANFVVVDSLDEIHPRDYVFVLQTLEKLVHPSRSGFAQVVVFGRPFCFEAYWQLHQREGSDAAAVVRGYMLRKPEFRTTGDIQVSNWNFDSWKFGLCRRSEESEQVVCFSDYRAWCDRGFSCDGEFSDIIFDANQHMTVEARQRLNRWISDEPSVAAVISNLAANGMVRDILVDQLQNGREFDERQFMKQFVSRWLKRDTQSDDRPSQIKPEYLDVYLRLLENVAAICSSSLHADGTFSVSKDEQVKVPFQGGYIAVSVRDLLNRSGLVTAEPFGEVPGRVRFEPLWLHRFLIGNHAQRTREENAKETPVALK